MTSATTTLPCAGRSLAVGLHWAFVASRAEARQQVKESGHAQYVLAASDEGLLLGGASAGKGALRGASLAGGVLVGQLLADAIVYEEIAPGRIWVCAVRGGLPLPEMDRVTDERDAQQVVADVRAYAQTPVTLVGSHPEAALTLAALIEQAEAPMLAAGKMRRASEGERLKFYSTLGIVCALLAGGAWWLLAPSEEDYLDEDEPVFFTEDAQQTNSNEAAQLLAQARENMLLRPDIGALTATWGSVIGGLPYAVGGYRPAQSECRRNVCQLQWNWRAPQFEGGYLAQLPGERLPSKTPGEYMRQVQTRIPLQSLPIRKLTGVRAEQLDDWAMALITTGRRVGARVDVMPASDAIKVNLPGGQGEGARTIGHEGRVTVVSTGWGRIRDVFALLADEQLTPERAVFSINGANVTLQMEARYVVPRD